MRQDKFIVPENLWDGDDINYAFDNNGLSHRLNDIDVIVAEVCGQNDGDDWYWILQMKDQTYSWAKGGCDYTGWGCQSSAEIHDNYKTALEALDALEFDGYGESRDRAQIKKCLEMQIKDELDFAVFIAN